jgi:hypothetical protein
MDTSIEQEIWKDIPGYEGYYQVSSLGRVKSLDRFVDMGAGIQKPVKERVMTLLINKYGYYQVSLRKNNLSKTFRVHSLVAITFLDHIRCGYEKVINHKNFNRLDNRVDNLEVTNQRENANRKHLKSSSKFTGVSWSNRQMRWRSVIRVNGNLISLGSFDDEKEASDYYQAALLAIEKNTAIAVKTVRNKKRKLKNQ